MRPMSAENPPEMDPKLSVLFTQPARIFRHLCADVEHQEGWHGADDEKPAPAEEGKNDPINYRCQQVTERITLLQNPGEQTTGSRRQRLHCKRSAQAPFTAKANSVKRTEDEQPGVAGRERGEQFHRRIKDDVDHQRHTPAEAVAEKAEYERADWPHCQRDGDGIADLRNRAIALGREWRHVNS